MITTLAEMVGFEETELKYFLSLVNGIFYFFLKKKIMTSP